MASATLVTKNDFRKKVWDHLEKNDLAEFPRPVHNRIPNFKGAPAAAHSLAALAEFKEAKVVKVNPDKPQETVRFLAMDVEKTVLVPTPRLRHGLFNRLMPPSLAKEDLHRVARAEGVRKFSSPIGLDNILPVDLIVVGSVAVSKDGYRIGKGEGYADLEYAMARGAGAVSEETLVITTVHDDQVFDYLPPELFGSHDLTVDVIVTPTQVIRVSQRHPKPTGIIWKLVTPRKLKAIPVLKALREVEAAAGKDVTLGEPTDDELAEVAARKSRRLRADGERGYPRRRHREQGAGDAEPAYSDADDDGAEKPRRRRPAAPRRRRRTINDGTSSDAQEEPEIETRREQRRRRRPPPPPAEPSRHYDEEGRRPRARRDRPPIDHADGLTVIVRRIPSDARPRDLREAIVAADSPATILSWKGRQGVALLRLRSTEAVKHLLAAGDNFRLVNESVLLEMYDRQRAAPRSERPERSERSERPQRHERPERSERPERPERQERSRSGGRRRPGPRAVSTEEADLTVFIGRLPASTRVRELRAALLAAGAVEPSIAWKGRRGMAFVRLKSPEAAEQLVAAADQLKVISEELVVERYKGKERDDSDAPRGLESDEGKRHENSEAPVKNAAAAMSAAAKMAAAAAGKTEPENAAPAGTKADSAKSASDGSKQPDVGVVASSSASKPDIAATSKPVAEPAAAKASDAQKAADGAAKPPGDVKAAEPVKTADAEAASPSLNATKPAEVKPESAAVQSEPASVKSEPAAGKSKPGTGKSEPSAVNSEPAAVKSEPVAVKSEPAAAKPTAAAVKSEPAAAKPEAVAVQSEPVAVESEPAAAKPEAAAVKSEPAAAKPEAAAVKSKPAAVESEPAAAKSEAAAVKSDPAAVESEPAAAKPEAAAVKSKPAAVESEPAAAKPEAAAVKSEPAAVESEPAAAAKPESAAVRSEPAAAAKPEAAVVKSNAASVKSEPTKTDVKADGVASEKADVPPEKTAAPKSEAASGDAKP